MKPTPEQLLGHHAELEAIQEARAAIGDFIVSTSRTAKEASERLSQADWHTQRDMLLSRIEWGLG